MLIFPKGIRFPESIEIPNSKSEKSEMLEKIRTANIEQGFVISEPLEDSIFKFYAEANIDADKIWDVFRNLCENLLPEEVMPIIGEDDDEILHNGKYDNKAKLLSLFEEYEFYLANDCFIQFGLGFESETELTEIFVTPTKHFQIWLNDSDKLRQLMKKFNIPEFEKLQFIDEFPRVTIALHYENNFQNHEQFIDFLVGKTGDYESFVDE